MNKLAKTLLPYALACGICAAAIPAGSGPLNWTQATRSESFFWLATRLPGGGVRKSVAALGAAPTQEALRQ